MSENYLGQVFVRHLRRRNGSSELATSSTRTTCSPRGETLLSHPCSNTLIPADQCSSAGGKHSAGLKCQQLFHSATQAEIYNRSREDCEMMEGESMLIMQYVNSPLARMCCRDYMSTCQHLYSNRELQYIFWIGGCLFLI